MTPTGVDCENYKLKSAYSEESFVSKKTMYIIKGSLEQKNLLLNLVGLFNSSLYSYLNLMLGTSIGIEREQRFMEEVLAFPYLYSNRIVEKVAQIQNMIDNQNKYILYNYDIDDDIKQLDDIILKEFGFENNSFVDYVINIQIPELTNHDVNIAYKSVTIEDLKEYGECFVNQFSSIYSAYGKYVSVKLYPSISNNYAAFELFINDDCSNDEIYHTSKTNDEMDLLARFSLYEYNDKFYQIRDVIHFDTNSFFIIKPKYYKYWHPAAAQIDLADVIEQIMSYQGGDE